MSSPTSINAAAALALMADLYNQLTDAQRALAEEKQAHALTSERLAALEATQTSATT